LKLPSERYLANRKYDGVRCMAIVKDGVILYSRHGNIINRQFPEVMEQLKNLPDGTILDGEVISKDNIFTNIQRRVHTKDSAKILNLQKEIPCQLIVFDILMYNNKVITNEPLKDRLLKLNSLNIDSEFDVLQLAEYDNIDVLWRRAISGIWEGIVVKDMLAIYEGKRTNAWRKMKIFSEGEMTLTSYTNNPKGIRAEDQKGRAIQIAGKQSIEVAKLLDKTKEVRIYIQYFDITEDGNYRHPSYRGLVKGLDATTGKEDII
jgi:ATP-dependent DNA ligase